MQGIQTQQDVLSRRLPFVMAGLAMISVLLLGRLASFQFQLPPEVRGYLDRLAQAGYSQTLLQAAARGLIYDRNYQPLAVNTLEYEIGVSPNLIDDPRESATQLAAILDIPELEVYERVISSQLWVSLAKPVSPELAQQVNALDLTGVTIDPIPRRYYPQGTLAAQVVGFMGGDLRGYNGVEGYYNEMLAGHERETEVSNIPFEFQLEESSLGHGADIVLTIDRDVQFLVEAELQTAITETGATGGTIIVMNPRNGAILAMANYPAFDPNAYYNVEDVRLLRNPAISDEYEPGSVMKVLTVAAALDTGAITPNWTYNDQGILDVAGIQVYNWDDQAHGAIDTAQVLVQSLNVGAATISTQWLGPERFYGMLDRFSIGQATGVDLEGEAAGTLWVPGDSEWSESLLATNSYGQGVTVTPLQMLTAISAVANGGLMMQPHVIHEITDGDQVITSQPSTLRRPISEETARIVTDMMVATVRDGVDQANVSGYTVAGKSGTAEIPIPTGYETDAWIMTFVGFLPADDPQISMLVKLDRPTSGRWASEVAAPVFQRLAQRLVILLEIPPDDIRHALEDQGGAVGEIRR